MLALVALCQHEKHHTLASYRIFITVYHKCVISVSNHHGTQIVGNRPKRLSHVGVPTGKGLHSVKGVSVTIFAFDYILGCSTRQLCSQRHIIGFCTEHMLSLSYLETLWAHFTKRNLCTNNMYLCRKVVC